MAADAFRAPLAGRSVDRRFRKQDLEILERVDSPERGEVAGSALLLPFVPPGAKGFKRRGSR